MQEEQYNSRDMSYSAWHRRQSTRRFVGIEHAQLLAMIDLDAAVYIEYDDGTKEPIALIEIAQDVGQAYKTATVTTKLAAKANIAAYVLLYTLSTLPNPADNRYKDISSFRVKQLWPDLDIQWKCFQPDEWAKQLLLLRREGGRLLDKAYGEEVKQLQMENTF